MRVVDFAKRLQAVESRVAAQRQQTAEPRGGPEPFKLMLLLLAVYEGAQQEREPLCAGAARALGYETSRAFYDALGTDQDDVNRRYSAAMERLLSKGGLTHESASDAHVFGGFLEHMVAGVPPELLRQGGLR